MLKHVQIAVPPGIGDGVWALMKVQSLLKSEGFDLATVAVCTGNTVCLAGCAAKLG